MRKILIIIDMQNDFLTGQLGSLGARNIIKNVINKAKSYPKEDIFATKDSHFEDYLFTNEGKNLPIIHCIKDSFGWEIYKDILPLIPKNHIINKSTFGSLELAKRLLKLNEKLEIELVGIHTDICVISNALLLKSLLPEAKIFVDSSCCAGTNKENHEASLKILKSCLIEVL